MATAQRKPVPSGGANFGSLEFYSGGGLLPKGKYCLKPEQIILRPPSDKAKGTRKYNVTLGVQWKAWNLDEPTAEPLEHFTSMGTEAHLSFMPNPDNGGKGIVPIPDAKRSDLPRDTSFMLFLASMYEAGMPKGFFTNDISVLDYCLVQIDHQPAPESWSQMRNNNAAAAMAEVVREQQGNSGPQNVPIVAAFLDGGKPWEDACALPEGFAEGGKPNGKAGAATTRSAAAPARAAAPVVAKVEDTGADEIANIAQSAMGDVLLKKENAAGINKTKFRVQTLAAVDKAAGAEMAAQVADSIFGSDNSLGLVLGEIGYKLVGANVVPEG